MASLIFFSNLENAWGKIEYCDFTINCDGHYIEQERVETIRKSIIIYKLNAFPYHGSCYSYNR